MYKCWKTHILVSLVLLVFVLPLKAIEKATFINVGQNAKYLHLPDSVDAEDAFARLEEYELSERPHHRYGVTSNVLWTYVDIRSFDTELNKLCILEPRISSIKLFRIENGVPKRVYESGYAYSFTDRHYNVSSYAYNISDGESREFLIRIQTKTNRVIPLYLMDEGNLMDLVDKKALIHGFYFGLLIIMILYNSFIYISVRDKSYLYYIIWLISMFLLQGFMSGMMHQFYFPEIPYLNDNGSAIYPPLAGTLAIIFIMSVLNTKVEMPRYHKFLIVGASLFILAFLLGVFARSPLAYLVTHTANFFGSLAVMVSAIRSAMRGNISARYISIGWFFIILSVILYILTENGAIGFNPRVSPHFIQVGSGVEILFFSFALADRINRYREAQVEAELERQRLLRESIEKDKEVSRRLAEMELKALRGQMNPHFVFNALSAIRYYIQHNESEQAESYLTKFARLIRMYLDSSKDKFLTLKREIELLTLYTDLETMRFDDKFKVEFRVDPEMDLEDQYIPSMIVQPLVENAINHGLHDRLDGQGELIIEFRKQQEELLVVVADNGIGMEASQRTVVDGHTSMATSLIQERIHTLKASELGEIDIQYDEFRPGDKDYPGTMVVLKMRGFDDE